MERISLLITDIDNTLFDWLGTWMRSFTYLIGQISDATGIDTPTLISESRRIHRCHGTSEYRFLIRELVAHLTGCSPQMVTRQFAESISNWLRIRDQQAVPYPGVADSLRFVRETGCTIVAYTESLRYYALRAVSRTGLDGLLCAIYALPDHQIPSDMTRHELATYGGSEPSLSKTISAMASLQMRKPDPEVLLRITRDFSVDFRKTVYIGDSLMKDVHMAQSAGAIDVYARYGDTRDSAAYALLREVSHWSDEEIQRDRMTTLRTVCPSYSVASFCEILKLFSFGPRT